MKKIFFMLFVALSVVSCSSGPEKAARNFIENMAKGDYEGAKKYSSPQTAALIDMAIGMGAQDRSLFPDYKFKMVKDSVVDNDAWVTYITPNGDEDVMNLKKIDGEWKVTAGK